MKKTLDYLDNISEKVNNILQNDDFSANVAPSYLHDEIKIYPLAGGKKLRPALLCGACGVLGGEIDKFIHFAAALEVWHNWTLVHDDIIDCDSVRRGIPTAHKRLGTIAEEKFNLSKENADKYGQSMAILCGDLQINWAFDLVMKGQKSSGISPALTLEIIRKIQDFGAIKLISGEAIDVELSVRKLEDIQISDIMRMIDGKTSALFQAACEIGGALALGSFGDCRVGILSEFAKALGRAFQLQDDLLGIFGNIEKLGKDIGSDLREEKTTVLLLKTLQSTTSDKKEYILSKIGQKELQVAELEEVKSIMTECGAYEFVNNEVQYYLQRAKDYLRELPDNEYNELLQGIITLLTSRDK